MGYSNPTTWDVDGIGLQHLATNFTTTTGITPPTMRGDDLTLPYRPGSIWQPKQAESRVIPFEGWVRGATNSGGEPSGNLKRQLFYDNWRALFSLIWQPGRQVMLRKRFWYNGAVKVVEAKAQFESGMEPKMIGPNAAKFTFNMRLADPWFYDVDWTQWNLQNGNNAIPIAGDTETRMVMFRINAPRVGVNLVCGETGVSLRYATTVGGGAATIDCYNYNSNVNGTPSNGAVTHAGSPSWFKLRNGNQNVQLGSDSGTGAVALYSKAAWL